MSHSILDLFILSLLDRGLETSYDLHIHGGLSLGSTVPALRRLGSAGLVRKKAPVGSSKRPRHWFQLSAAGTNLARAGWVSLLKDQPPSDFDALLRLADMAQHYRARPGDIVKFLEAAASERRSSARISDPARTGIKGSAPFSTFAPLKRRGLGVEVVRFERVVGGPDRDRTDDLFHAISATSRNSLKLHDTNRDETQHNAHIFPVIGPLLDPKTIPEDEHLDTPFTGSRPTSAGPLRRSIWDECVTGR